MELVVSLTHWNSYGNRVWWSESGIQTLLESDNSKITDSKCPVSLNFKGEKIMEQIITKNTTVTQIR